jgi:hypothetical protein
MTAAAVTSSSPFEPASALVARMLPLHAAVYGTVVALPHPRVATKCLVVLLWGAAGLATRFRAARMMAVFSCLMLTMHLFPEVPNHGYLFCLALLIAASFDTKSPIERSVMTESFRFLAAIVWFWSGVQKSWSGTWTHGQLLAYEIGHSQRFKYMLGWLTNRAERRALHTDGPFLGNTSLTLLGQSIWILEVAIGIGLLVLPHRFRKHCIGAAIALLIGIEIIARESVFGILMIALLVPSLDIRLRARYLLVLVPIELLTLAGHLSLVPGGFH